MTKVPSILLLATCLMGCECNRASTNISGDLYYSWLKLGSFYGHPDSLIDRYQAERDSLGWEAMVEQDSAGASYIKMLEENDLLTSPFIYLKKENGHVVTLFLSHRDYTGFTRFTYQSLIDEGKKVRLEVKADSLWQKIYICRGVISVELLAGQTLQRPGKFKIEDYR